MSIQYFAGPEKEPGLECVADILICLGDFWTVNDTEGFVERLVLLCEAGWKEVIYVPGILEANVIEYETAVDYLFQLDARIENFHFLYNSHLDLPEYRLRIFGTPLFTDMAYDADEATEAGRRVLGEFLPLPGLTTTVNHAFSLPETAEKEEDIPKGQPYTKGADGQLRICLPLSKYWWATNHRECRAQLLNAISDAQVLADDWVFVVATHWQPSCLLDKAPEAGSEQEKQGDPISDCSLRYSVELPVRQYARLLNRTMVWFYAQAKEYGRAYTGIPAIDEKIMFMGTPSQYQPGKETYAVRLISGSAPTGEAPPTGKSVPDGEAAPDGESAPDPDPAAAFAEENARTRREVYNLTEEVYEAQLKAAAAAAEHGEDEHGGEGA